MANNFFSKLEKNQAFSSLLHPSTARFAPGNTLDRSYMDAQIRGTAKQIQQLGQDAAKAGARTGVK